jgi:glycine dehydrogenase
LRFRAEVLYNVLEELGVKVITDRCNFFDTLAIDCTASGFSSADWLLAEFHKFDYNLRKIDNNRVGISFNESTTIHNITAIIEIFAKLREVCDHSETYLPEDYFFKIKYQGIPKELAREGKFMQ